ncbi:hypothetical protein PsorP6_008192 [Peronosclerospora sorghi]|uniref:Uncharacterized protein n=1 Tax=Peronosclerospora sorghi TaxID=230839 RepID=A0ACC0WEG1_9STRA|nr:hypothetical protein PsorP6_008192 [Peronosclerospora sorghi]
MSSEDNEETWHEKLEQLQNALTLAQYEAEKWKEKYLVEKQRRQKMARELLDHVVRMERHSHGTVDATTVDRSSSPFSNSIDTTAKLLSPTFSSFDFDDDSSEESSEEMNGQVLSSKPSHVEELDARMKDVGVKSDLTTEWNMLSSLPRALELRDRRALLHHSASSKKVRGRYNRSLTAGSAFEVFTRSSRRILDGREGMESEHSPQRLINCIMQTKPLSCDVWHAHMRPNKGQNVARSFLFSSQLKMEHIFERFFITGRTFFGGTEQTSELFRYWKPKLLYEYPQRLDDSIDESVADFCFPKGVPLIRCNHDQAASIRGVPVSKWFTEIEPLEHHVQEAVDTSGYTFRLTGAKGQVVYGFCVVIMKEVRAIDESVDEPTSESPSCPDENTAASCGLGNEMTMLAPICYCFTSKFPFYRFHFALLRMLVENEFKEQRLESEHERDGDVKQDEEYEVVLRPQVDLEVAFKRVHEERCRIQDHVEQTGGPRNLSSIATKLTLSPCNPHVVLSEDASVSVPSNNEWSMSNRQPSQFRKSFSTDNIGLYHGTNEWIVEKPMVKSICLNPPKPYEQVKIGDVLEAIDGIATASMKFDQSLSLLEESVRPLRLRFRRLNETGKTGFKPFKHRQRYLSATSIDMLHRARQLPMNAPGHWSTARFPTFECSYQFPTRRSDRWAVGVVLRFLTPDKVVESLATLLLEKQLVIMSDSPAKFTAVCTALLLLLSPFQWQSTYIPLLPARLLDFLHSPVPFLIGCHTLSETSDWPEVCFYDIDNDVLAHPSQARHSLPSSIPNGIELCRLLGKAQERYRLLCGGRPKPWYELSDEQDTIITLTLQEAAIFLRDLGFDIPCEDLAASAGGQSVYDRLQEEVAKEVRKSMYEDFLDEFTQTQLFYQYYEGLLQPNAQRESAKRH